MVQYLVTFLVGILGSALSATCGAGAGLVTSPYCILLGLPPHIAVGTAKFGGIGLAFGSLMRFRNTEHIRWEFVWPFILLNVASGLVGICILVFLPAYTVKHIVAYAVLLALPFLFIRKLGIERFQASVSRRRTGYVLKFLAETAQGAFGAGLGIISSLVVMLFFWVHRY